MNPTAADPASPSPPPPQPPRSSFSFLASCRALKEEKYDAHSAILPLLQVSNFCCEWKKYLEEEARIMKDVPNLWKVGENVCNSGRWMPPVTGELRPDIW
ncbi:unnamed protein product [Coffea canephora]|uniref:NADH dehydrogenase [ubiquinone] 1 alpha subcomplex subunit 13 n=1 Tax=Coffea canephora TaxID=49390 RepID=A0A068V704_COFCA|nr:unnamed protein product [Coffea canephora]